MSEEPPEQPRKAVVRLTGEISYPNEPVEGMPLLDSDGDEIGEVTKTWVNKEGFLMAKVTIHSTAADGLFEPVLQIAYNLDEED